MHDRRCRDPPIVALSKLHVVVLTSCNSRLVLAAPLRHFAGTDGDEGREFAPPDAAAVTTEGELAGDFGGEVAEEVGHGDEATADDAGCDLGDTVVDGVVSLMRCGEGGNFQTHVHKATGNR